MNHLSSDGCRSVGNGSGSALRTVDVMGAGSPCARADRTPASSISADIARYSSGGKRTICSRVHTDTPPGTNPRIPRGCCIEVSNKAASARDTMHGGRDARWVRRGRWLTPRGGEAAWVSRGGSSGGRVARDAAAGVCRGVYERPGGECR